MPTSGSRYGTMNPGRSREGINKRERAPVIDMSRFTVISQGAARPASGRGHDMTAPAHDGLIAGRYQLVAPIGSGGTASSSGRHRAAKERRLARGRPGSAAPSQRPRPQ